MGYIGRNTMEKKKQYQSHFGGNTYGNMGIWGINVIFFGEYDGNIHVPTYWRLVWNSWKKTMIFMMKHGFLSETM